MKKKKETVLTFNEALHEYRINGVVVPSVTQITRSLTDYSRVPPAVLDRKRDLGVALHKAVEIYLKGEFETAALPDSFLPYFGAFTHWLDKEKFEPDQSELRVYSESAMYAGTLDLTGKTAKGRRAIVDFKCTAQLMPAAKIQTAGYAQACAEMGDTMAERYVLQLKPDGTYRFELYKDKADFTVFNSLLQSCHWLAAHTS